MQTEENPTRVEVLPQMILPTSTQLLLLLLSHQSRLTVCDLLGRVSPSPHPCDCVQEHCSVAIFQCRKKCKVSHSQ